MKNKLSYILVLSTFTGTIIGAGIFGLPYVASKAGFWPIIYYFLIIGFITIMVNLLFGEIVTGTSGQHRLPGFAEKYLGIWGKRATFIVTALGLFGVILAYLILGGQFLFNLFSPLIGGNLYIYVLIYFAAGAYFIFRGARTISHVETIFLVLMILIPLAFLFLGFPKINYDHLMTFDLKNIFLPYGVIIFALWGLEVIPELKDMLVKEYGHAKYLKSIIILSVVISIIVYLIFTFAVLGITGKDTSTEGINGLKPFFGEKVIILGSIFGLIATFTSYITFGLTLRKIFNYDFKVSKNLSWFIACFLPLALYFIGMRNFINVLSLTGGILLGIEAIIVFIICIKGEKKCEGQPAYKIWLPNSLKYVMILILLAGIFVEVFNHL
jgi:tyrosine-specific transport protein